MGLRLLTSVMVFLLYYGFSGDEIVGGLFGLVTVFQVAVGVWGIEI